MPARAPESNKDPRLSETTQDVASLGQFLPAREHGSSKRLAAFREYIRCIISGTSSARQEHTRGVKARGVRRVHKLHHRWYK